MTHPAVEPYRMIEPQTFSRTELLTVDTDPNGSRLAALCAQLPLVRYEAPPCDCLYGFIYALPPSLVLWALIVWGVLKVF